jgi:hypothetical protein
MPTPRRTSFARTTALAAVSLCLLGVGLVRALPAAAREQPLNLKVTVSLVPGSGATLRYRGTFTGTPFGRGTANLRTTISGAGIAQVSFELTTSRGRISGSGKILLTYSDDDLVCRGTATITGGTGAYTRIRARDLRISGSTPIRSRTSTLSLTGKITS